MSQFIQPQQIAEKARIAAQAACDAAAQARISAQLAREYIDSQPLTSIETNEIRTPNYNYTSDNSYEYIIYNNNVSNNDNIIDYINIHPTIRFEEPRQSIDIIYKTLLISDEESICCICMESREKNEICSLNCDHVFCGYCVENCLKMQDIYVCSLCRETVIVITCQKLEIIEKLKDYF
jgi:hypothetical protein